jgi:hypothetical protein
VTLAELLERNRRIGEGQRRAWRDPGIRARRTKAIRNAWDDPLRRALMSRAKTTPNQKDCP